MDFIEDETRPRFHFQSRSAAAAASSQATYDPASGHQNKSVVFVCVSLSLLFLASSIFLLQTDLIRSLSLWISISLLLGPFAPSSFTGGDIRVGCGEIVEFPPPQEDPAPVDDSRRRRQKVKRSEELGFGMNSTSNSNLIRNGSASQQGSNRSDDPRSNSVNGGSEREKDSAEEGEWTDEDMEMLKKQILKNPVGKPRRWEVIAEAFNGRHGVQSVIKMSKSMGDAKPEDSDSYSKFLKNRKPVDKRADDQASGDSTNAGGGEGPVSAWSSGEDIALLNALKSFPKEAAMRWEKIAAAVPGKSKAACMKRVTDLKRDFRSSKSAGAADS